MHIIALFACLSVLLTLGYLAYCVGLTLWLEMRERLADAPAVSWRVTLR